jgi:hypothetical protein
MKGQIFVNRAGVFLGRRAWRRDSRHSMSASPALASTQKVMGTAHHIICDTMKVH